LRWREDLDFSKLKNVTQAHGFLFNGKGEILIVSSDGGKTWGLAGGTPEREDKSYVDTLIREVEEEADVEIDKISPIGYLTSTFIDEPKTEHHQLRYVARVVKVKEQTDDPAHGKIILRKFIKPEEFLVYCPWGLIGKAMLEVALEKINSGNY